MIPAYSPRLSDGSILRSLGLMLARDEAGVAHPTSTPVLYRRCAWHGGVIGFKSAERAELAGTYTDTICPECRAKMEADLAARRQAA
jgi:hypothetical protein